MSTTNVASTEQPLHSEPISRTGPGAEEQTGRVAGAPMPDSMAGDGDYDAQDDQAEVVDYRELSRSAVASLVFALLSPFVFMTPVLIVLPVAGLVFGLLSLWRIRRLPRELSGRGLATVGSAMCMLMLVSGSALHTYVYATEVPDGYLRISFADLQADPRYQGQAVPRSALALDGRQVFVKGYVHPSVGGLGPVRQFVLVPDLDTCCFGGQPKLTDMIEVTIPEGQPIEYSLRKRKLAGTLKVDTTLKRVDGLTGVFYQLVADHVE